MSAPLVVTPGNALPESECLALVRYNVGAREIEVWEHCYFEEADGERDEFDRLRGIGGVWRTLIANDIIELNDVLAHMPVPGVPS